MLWLLLTGSIIAKNEPKNSNVKIFKMTKISNLGEKSGKIKESNIKTSKSQKKIIKNQMTQSQELIIIIIIIIIIIKDYTIEIYKI